VGTATNRNQVTFFAAFNCKVVVVIIIIIVVVVVVVVVFSLFGNNLLLKVRLRYVNLNLSGITSKIRSVAIFIFLVS